MSTATVLVTVNSVSTTGVDNALNSQSSPMISTARLMAGDHTMIAFVVSIGGAILLLTLIIGYWRYKSRQKRKETQLKANLREQINFNQEPRKMTTIHVVSNEPAPAALISPASPAQSLAASPISSPTASPLASPATSPSAAPLSSSYTSSSLSSSLSSHHDILTPTLVPISPRAAFRAPPPLSSFTPSSSSGILRVHVDMTREFAISDVELPGSLEQHRNTYLPTEYCDVIDDGLEDVAEEPIAV